MASGAGFPAKDEANVMQTAAKLANPRTTARNRRRRRGADRTTTKAEQQEVVENAEVVSNARMIDITVTNLAGEELEVTRMQSCSTVFDLKLSFPHLVHSKEKFVGNDVTKDRCHCDGWSNAEFIFPDLKFDSEGEVFKWTFYARNSAGVKLQVWRPSPGDSNFTLVGVDNLETVPGTNIVEVPIERRIRVEPGDCLGIMQLNPASIPSEFNSSTSSPFLSHLPNARQTEIGKQFPGRIREGQTRDHRDYAVGAYYCPSARFMFDGRILSDADRLGDVVGEDAECVTMQVLYA